MIHNLSEALLDGEAVALASAEQARVRAGRERVGVGEKESV